MIEASTMLMPWTPYTNRSGPTTPPYSLFIIEQVEVKCAYVGCTSCISAARISSVLVMFAPGMSSIGPSSCIASVAMSPLCFLTAATIISTSAGFVSAPQSISGGSKGSRLLMKTVPRLRGLTKVRGISELLVKPVSRTEVVLEL